MYDIAIIGGGVNGCGIARDAAGRGLRVLLAEMNDLASGTSSSSTKLVHGGLRYLEHYEFKLVRESLVEREVLYGMAPHIVRPLRFVFPHHPSMRPAWLIRLGLFFYDHLGSRKILPGSRAIKLDHDEAGAPLKPQFTRAFEYSDCRVDDARLVILNAIDAARYGADIKVQTKVSTAKRHADHWTITLNDKLTGHEEIVKARTLINAAGPWVSDVVANNISIQTTSKVRQVKGSHIVVPKLFDHERAYIFQNGDKRIIFAIPYEEKFTLIGTTDVDYPGDPSKVHISREEISYLCEAANEYFKTPIGPADVISSFSGVRPLFSEEGVSAQETTRDYVLERNGEGDEPVLLSIFGGKITTYRHLAESVLDKISDQLPQSTKAPWTMTAPLPGGDFIKNANIEKSIKDLVQKLTQTCPHIDAPLALRLVRAYGNLALEIFMPDGVCNEPGQDFGNGLFEIEVSYLINREWVRSSEDILWRRSKLGLVFTPKQTRQLDDWLVDAVERNQHVA